MDRSSIDLPGSQIPLLEALVKTGIPVVVLLINGRPATFGRGNKVSRRLYISPIVSEGISFEGS